MEPFKVHILGCGSALPTLQHNASSQIVELREKLFMIDCGEGTQMQLRRSRIHFSKIIAVFISHLHGDHCFGLPGMISTFGMTGRTAPLHIYAPAAFEPILDQTLSFFCQGLEFKVVFHAVDTTQNKVVYEDRSLTVETIPLQHRIDCCGYLFREKPILPHIRRDMIDFYKDFYETWDDHKADEMLELFKINRNDYIDSMSKGNIAKVKLVMAFCLNMKYIILDEPFGGIDVFKRKEFVSMMAQYMSDDQALILTTHEIEDIESVVDYVHILNDGRLVASFDAEEMRLHEGKSILDKIREVSFDD